MTTGSSVLDHFWTILLLAVSLNPSMTRVFCIFFSCQREESGNQREQKHYLSYANIVPRPTIEKGGKRPDPARLKALTDYPVPTTTMQLRRLIGFFAYYAKWVKDYSNKVKPLLCAFQNKLLPLSADSVKANTYLKSSNSSASLASACQAQQSGRLSCKRGVQDPFSLEHYHILKVDFRRSNARHCRSWKRSGSEDITTDCFRL